MVYPNTGASSGYSVIALRLHDGALLWKTFVSDTVYGVSAIGLVSSSVTEQPQE